MNRVFFSEKFLASFKPTNGVARALEYSVAITFVDSIARGSDFP